MNFSKNTFLCILFCFVVVSISTASSPDYDHEILTMFAHNTVDWPAGKTTMAVDDVTFNPPEIKDLLLAHTAQIISKAFPDYDPADSILVSPQYPHIKIKQMELDLVFRIYLNDKSLRDTLNVELNSYQEVLFSEKNGAINLDDTIPDPYFPLHGV